MLKEGPEEGATGWSPIGRHPRRRESTKDNTVIVKVDDNCKLEYLRSAIASVQPRRVRGGRSHARVRPSHLIRVHTSESNRTIECIA
jgi:hypothetical protein